MLIVRSHTVVTVSLSCTISEILPLVCQFNKLCESPPQYAPAPCKLTFDLLTLKVVSESRVTWATSVPILVFLGHPVLDLGPIYATDRQTSDAHHRLMPPTLWVGLNKRKAYTRVLACRWYDGNVADRRHSPVHAAAIDVHRHCRRAHQATIGRPPTSKRHRAADPRRSFSPAV